MKIRTAIFVVYVAASAVGFAVLMRFMLAEVRPRYVNSLQHTLGETARLLAALIEAGPGQDESVALARLKNAKSDLQVTVATEDGTVLFAVNSSEILAPDYARNTSPGLVKHVANRVIDSGGDTSGEVSASATFARKEGGRGIVTVSRPVRSLNAVVWAERKKLAFSSLLIAGAMTAAGWWIAAKLTRSLERLTSYVEAVRDGRPASPPASRAKEIAALGGAFEEMREALEGKAYIERYTQALTHEIKAPLTAIRGAAELLHESMPMEERARFLAHLRVESERIQQIVERLLQLSAIEARRGLQGVERLDLGVVVDEAVEALRPVGLGRRIVVEVTRRPPSWVRGERFLLVQAVTNLLQNAIEFSPAGGRIEVRVEPDERHVVLRIEDEGPGVPDYALPRIFERFYSLPRPATQRKSTGLGLSFVREIAGLHGGEVSICNRSEGGARAELRLIKAAM